MKNAHLKMYKIEKLEFKNNVNGTVSLNFGSRVSHHVKYSNNKMCEGSMDIEVADPKQPDTIALKITVNGVFELTSDATKEEVHVETAKELFVLAKSFVTTISAVAGIKPIIINDVDFDKQEIMRYNVGDIRRSLGLNKKPPKDANVPDDTVDGPDGSDL